MPAFASSIPVSGAAAPNSPPSSAAVLEHVCLFTHDLRRKQKRWQDGRLKFHTFNKRVMVYDERGNFIGDMHWRRDYDFDEGEEIELERGGVIVQVAECVGRREQDLSELLDKRAKEKEQRQLSLAARSNGSLSVRPTPRAAQADHFQVRHRPLHQLIGTPTGHHGRALAPSESPFEQRHSPKNGPEEQGSRAPKRRKYDDAPSKSGYAQALFGATLTLSATPMSSAPIRQRPSTARSPSVEVETHDPSQDQEVLREKSKSSRHFNQQDARKARHEPDALKKVDSLPPSRPIAFLEPAPVIRRPQQARSPKADDLLHVNRQPEVITVEDDDVDDIMRDENSMLSSVPSGIPSRQRTGKNLPEKSKKSKARVEPEAIREVLEDQPSEVRPSVPKSKSKSMDPEPEPKRTKSTATESARHGKTLQNDVTTKFADTPAKKPEEARTELRIKPRKKRGLLMMSEQVKTTPREPTRPSASEHSTISKPTASNEASDEDDPFGSSPPKVNQQEPHSRDRRKETPSLVSEFTAQRNTNSSCPNVDNCNDEDNDTSLEAEVTTSKRTRNRRRTILNDDDDDEVELLDEPPKKRRARPATADADIATIETEDQVVEAPKKKQRKSKKAPDLEETNVTETDGNDTTTSRRNPKRAAAQHRRRAKEDTPVDVDSSDFGETDEVRERPKKRQRSDELPQVPAGPRLARLSKKSVKSREVIGFVLKDGAMFRGLGTATRPPVQQPVPQQDAELPEPIPEPITAKTKSAKVPETSRANEKLVPSKSEQPEPAADRSTRTTRPREELEPSKNLMLKVPTLPVALKEGLKPSARQEIQIENNGPPSIKNDSLVDPEQQSPVPKASEAQKPAEQVEADFLEGVTLSPIVLSPVKPSVTATGSSKDLPVHDTSAENIPKPPPVPQHTEEPRLPEQLLPCPALPPERRTINGLGRSNSVTSILQSRVQSTIDNTRPPESPQNAAAKPPAVARIVNPATRGRKAALKSDAAGKVPQSVLPPNPAAAAGTTTTTAGGVTVIYIERPAPPAAEAEPSEPKAVKKMTFPGFAPARQTGPWSREAFDLLEKGRPV